MDFKKIDKHTPQYYFNTFKQGFESTDPKTVSATLFGLIFSFSKDFDMLCPNMNASKDYVRDVVDYLDRKYTATIRYFQQRGLCIGIPDVGYRESFLGSRPDVAARYGAESGLIF